MVKRRYIGELLVDAGLISREQLDNALEFQKNNTIKKQIGDILVDLGYITENQLHEVLEFQMGIPYIDLNRTLIPDEISATVPVMVARRTKSVPVRVSGNKLYVAMADPFNLHAIEDIEIVSKLTVMPLLGKESSIMQAIDDLYGNVRAERALEDFRKENDMISAVNEIRNTDDETVGSAPIVRLVNSILEQAVNDGEIGRAHV